MMTQPHHFLIRNVTWGVPAISLDCVVPGTWSHLQMQTYCGHYSQPFRQDSTCTYICKAPWESLQKHCCPSNESSYHSYEVGTCIQLTKRETEAQVGSVITSLTYFSQQNSSDRVDPVWFEITYLKSRFSAASMPMKSILNEWLWLK